MIASANAFHSSTVYYDPANRLRQPSYTRLNGEVGLWLDDRRYRIAVFGKNLTDKADFSSLITSARADYGAYAKPRVVGVLAEVHM